MQEYIELAQKLEKKLNIVLTSDEILDKLEIFCDSLIYWNGITNLTTIIEPEDIFTKHFYDSLTCLHLWKKEWKKVYDVGTGGGFPGVPLAIVLPDTNFFLVESNSKKCDFIMDLINILGLRNITVINKRAEEIKSEDGDLVITRAVSRADIILEITCRLLKVGSYNLQMRGENFKEDSEWTKPRAKELGYELEDTFEINDVGKRRTGLILYKYINRADDKYPRRYSAIIRK